MYSDIPKNEKPPESVIDNSGNKVEGVEIVQIPDAEAKKLGVYNAALKISFRQMEQNANKIFRKAAKNTYKIQTGQKTPTPAEQRHNEIMLYFSQTAKSDLENFSPENIWKKNFIKRAEFMAQMQGIRANNSLRNISIRFPAEAVMFYGVIAANACAFSGLHYLSIGARTNLACLDTFTNSFKDPISTLSFASFVGGSAATQLAGSKILSYIDAKALGLREDILRKQYDNVAQKEVLKGSIQRLESNTFSAINPKLGAIPKLGFTLAPTGMAMGMLVSRIFEESLRDENIQMCAKGIYLNAKNESPSEKDANLPQEFMLHCQTAWDSWMKSNRWQHYGYDMIGLVSASFASHGLMWGLTHSLKAVGGGIAEGFVKALQFQFNFGANGLKSMAPQYEFLNRALSPFTPSSIINLSGFMAVDHGVISHITSAVKIDDQKKKLHFTKYKDIEPGIDRLIKDYSSQNYPVDQNFDRIFRDYSSDMALLRQMKTASVSEAVSNWMNKTNEFLAVYQGANQFYRDFFYRHALAQKGSTTERNPFDSRDYLRKVISWIDRGKFEGNPIGLIVDSVDQPLSAGTEQFPISVVLKAVGYTGNEIDNYPFYSKLETVSRVASELMNGMIEGMMSSEAGGRYKALKNELTNLLSQLTLGTTKWEEVVPKILPKLNDEQKEILKIYLDLRAADYNFQPAQVLSAEDMKVLKYDENYKLVSEAKNHDVLRKFQEPTGRDIIKLITRADDRSIKELEFRMKRAEAGVKRLDAAAKKFPDSAVIVVARINLGEPSETAPAGTKFLSDLMSDPMRFPPDLFMHYPKNLQYIHSLRPVDFLMTSLACGEPKAAELKPVRENATFSELVSSPLVGSPIGSALVFKPPAITYIDKKVLKNEICEVQQSAQKLYDREFKFGGRIYKGFIQLVLQHIPTELQGFEYDKPGVESQYLKFDTWWGKHVRPVVSGILEKLQAEYYHIVIKDIIPKLTEEKVFEHLNEDTEFNVKVIRQLSEANVDLTKKEARKSSKWDKVSEVEDADLALYKLTDTIKTKMHAIEEFLVQAAQSNKIFPPGQEKADISYLAVSNEKYLNMRKDLLNDIVTVGKALDIQIDAETPAIPGQIQAKGQAELKINGGRKFATGSEGQRVKETALRNVINNINELHRYSDMIYLLTKSIN
ncbi:MAG: hypothetical protein A4S09_16480 [Proteobacteria bacterium SG_bin7]|nr:MAG: hypothetical protein A4S09_16480 [Proteobacteria bacterium SG_bin7]